ncbi:uncharacterized protein LOC115875764 [Sitophilus oryzae]|uniref:Uncharacterized protein LOC115875764 n=1 Tax=Sitophilus oryzae TaxID=7048 RepID=A0A6J2X8E0_SITOR|nr:uncharacterized protein LOC115875764 [Sitophilus oryzae]
MSENNEIFIETVRSYVFLYDTTHEHYKNMLKKSEAWNEIAKTLNMTAESAKQKWKNLRDSYVRYKKFTTGKTGQAKKYHKWPWSIHMKFLDYTLKPRLHSSNVPTEILSETEDSQFSEAENLLMSDDTQETNASRERSSTPLRTPARPKEKKNKSRSHPSIENGSDDVDKVIDFLSNKRSKQGIDDVDHLFLSYAATFKKFSPLTQAKLKVELAKLFAETEIKELEAQSPPAIEASASHSRASSVNSLHYLDHNYCGTSQHLDPNTQTQIYSERSSCQSNLFFNKRCL